jgi:hypothetical protein
MASSKSFNSSSTVIVAGSKVPPLTKDGPSLFFHTPHDSHDSLDDRMVTISSLINLRAILGNGWVWSACIVVLLTSIIHCLIVSKVLVCFVRHGQWRMVFEI